MKLEEVKKLKDSELNAIIAKTQRWKFEEDEDCPGEYWHNPEGRFDILPEYSSDLNLIHKARGIFKDSDWRNYEFNLYNAIMFDIINRDGSISLYNATSRQQAEAFVLTIQ